MPERLTASNRELGLILGLGDLQHGPVCHGYQHACPCCECRERAVQTSPRFLAWLSGTSRSAIPPVIEPKRSRQPWEPRKAAA